MGDVELKILPAVSDNNNVTSGQEDEVTPGNGTTEDSHLLSTPPAVENNRDNVDEVAVNIDPSDNSNTSAKWRRELRSLQEQLNEVVVWKLKLWVVILLIFILILLIIGISIIACTVEVDADEYYDRSKFVVKRLFRGNVTLSSWTSQPMDQDLLEEQLRGVYSSSHALGRYFSNVTINNLQNAVAQFELQFLMPSEHEDLSRFTLSVKMVKNVLLQNFYDQYPDVKTTLNMKEVEEIQS